jgi:hypothetical protein
LLRLRAAIMGSLVGTVCSRGDNPATISRADQQDQTVAATVDLLARLASPAG